METSTGLDIFVFFYSSVIFLFFGSEESVQPRNEGWNVDLCFL